ncbi:MAG: rRNA adenine N(6)-methyltransferase family protein [Chloroflexota bacterium]|nr:rRNA adenine N(6)-methyltransferase family protein [Chloroflexota bacterium]
MPSSRHSDLGISQNFLRSPALVRRLVQRSAIGPDDLVVEIGPGKGIITEQLAASCRQVLAIEKDPALALALRRRLAPIENVTLFAADVLDFPLPISPYKIFANIPFNATAAIITRLTSGGSAPDDTFVIVQAEAAARFLGQPRETLAALLLKPWFEPAIMHRFKRGDFMPAPHVDVVMLRLKKRGPPLISAHQRQAYRDFVTVVMTSWQPTVSAGLGRIEDQGTVRGLAHQTRLNLDQAPSRFPFSAWLALFKAYLADRGPDRASSRLGGAEARLIEQQRRLQKVHRTRVARRSRQQGQVRPK